MAQDPIQILSEQARAAQKEIHRAMRDNDTMAQARATMALHKIRQQYQALLRPDLFNVKTAPYKVPRQPLTKDRK